MAITNLRFSIRDLLSLTVVAVLAVGWFAERKRSSSAYQAIAREHERLFLLTHAYQDVVKRSKCDVGFTIDLTGFPIALEQAGDPSQYPVINSWP